MKHTEEEVIRMASFWGLNATQSASAGFRYYLLYGFMWFDATEICFGKRRYTFSAQVRCRSPAPPRTRPIGMSVGGAWHCFGVCAWRWLVSLWPATLRVPLHLRLATPLPSSSRHGMRHTSALSPL